MKITNTAQLNQYLAPQGMNQLNHKHNTKIPLKRIFFRMGAVRVRQEIVPETTAVQIYLSSLYQALYGVEQPKKLNQFLVTDMLCTCELQKSDNCTITINQTALTGVVDVSGLYVNTKDIDCWYLYDTLNHISSISRTTEFDIFMLKGMYFSVLQNKSSQFIRDLLPELTGTGLCVKAKKQIVKGVELSLIDNNLYAFYLASNNKVFLSFNKDKDQHKFTLLGLNLQHNIIALFDEETEATIYFDILESAQ